MGIKRVMTLLTTGLACAAAVADTTSRPTADQTMDKLLGSGTTANRSVGAPTTQETNDRTGGAAAVAPGAPNNPLKREGSRLMERVGRLNHSADGSQAVFTFDADAATMKDAPLIILPNLKLAGMESAATGAAKDVRFRVSGTITEYKGRNYILVDKFVVVSDVDQGV